MKKIYIILLLGWTICFMSCQNFDEINDTTQRSVTLRIDTTHLFDWVLQPNSEGELDLMVPTIIPDSMRLRIKAYCYDQNGLLLYNKVSYHHALCVDNIKFLHLQKNIPYNIKVFADIVKYDKYVSCYEVWKIMDEKLWENLCAFAPQQYSQAAYNTMHLGQAQVYPNNDTLHVDIKPITLNGYLVIRNPRASSRYTIYVDYVDKFKPSSEEREKTTHIYQFNSPTEDIKLPATIPYGSKYNFKIKRQTSSTDSDSLVVYASSNDNNPFLLTVNGTGEMKVIENYTYTIPNYER